MTLLQHIWLWLENDPIARFYHVHTDTTRSPPARLQFLAAVASRDILLGTTLYNEPYHP